MVNVDKVGLEPLARYMANALVDAAEQTAWPDDIRGNACRLLVQDLGEFGATMVAASRVNFWSPALALERMWIERFEVLMGVVADDRFARRYLDSVLKAPRPDRPLEPKTKARAEDAIGAIGRSAMFSNDEVAAFRNAVLEIKNVASDWFVHPTSMGPLLSRSIRGGQENPNDSWLTLISLLSFGCFWAIAATSRCGVTTPVQLIRALDGAVQAHEHLGSPMGATLRELHQDIAKRVSAI